MPISPCIGLLCAHIYAEVQNCMCIALMELNPIYSQVWYKKKFPINTFLWNNICKIVKFFKYLIHVK